MLAVAEGTAAFLHHQQAIKASVGIHAAPAPNSTEMFRYVVALVFGGQNISSGVILGLRVQVVSLLKRADCRGAVECDCDICICTSRTLANSKTSRIIGWAMVRQCQSREVRCCMN